VTAGGADPPGARGRTALITGVTGQDGAYLAELLLSKGYEVHGVKRRASLINTERVDGLYRDPHDPRPGLRLHYGDLTDATALRRLVESLAPDELYNLGAMSHVRVSFDMPEYTAQSAGLGALRLLEALRQTGLAGRVRYLQASTSEMFGRVQASPQTETTPFHPRSPYGVAKLFAYWTTVNYREAHGIHASNGILFNHESPLRGETFVTRKIARAAVRIAHGEQPELFLGNLDARRDWGHARDFVEAMWRICQQPEPADYVLATGRSTSVRDLARMMFARAGMELSFEGHGAAERGRVARRTAAVVPGEGDTVIRVDPRYFRPAEVDWLVGDAARARQRLGWKPSTTLEELVAELVDAEERRWRLDSIRRGS
jgi:GDPmannose 4,6-dehydratase